MLSLPKIVSRQLQIEDAHAICAWKSKYKDGKKRNEITPFFQTENTEPKIVSKEMGEAQKKNMPKSS